VKQLGILLIVVDNNRCVEPSGVKGTHFSSVHTVSHQEALSPHHSGESKLERFPRIHSGHHNNKVDSHLEIGLL
jgi:hypothetical protein